MNKNYYEAIETCPYGDTENIYPMWDVNAKGFVAICKHCGKKILLCNQCINTICDWHNVICFRCK